MTPIRRRRLGKLLLQSPTCRIYSNGLRKEKDEIRRWPNIEYNFLPLGTRTKLSESGGQGMESEARKKQRYRTITEAKHILLQLVLTESGLKAMLSVCSQPMWFHSHLIWF
jgi:hypothetical protein